jgi:hypothetical protein
LLLGVNLMLLLGPSIPLPAPGTLTQALERIQVTHQDRGRSGFQMVFHTGRSGPGHLVDYPQLPGPLLKPFSRVVLVVLFNLQPRVLMDGIITRQELGPGSEPGEGTLTVTGEDVSVMMDLKKKRAEHPAQDETLIALKLIAGYVQYGLVPMVIPPAVIDPPIPIERVPVQQDTDLRYLEAMAARHGYTFYVKPGPVPLTNTAYWGPPNRLGLPQRALSVNMGPQTNVTAVNFQYNGLSPTLVDDVIQDRLTNRELPVRTFMSLRPPLVSQPALPFNLPNVRTTLLDQGSGLNVTQAMARAQAVTDQSVDEVVTATGTIDAMRYGDVLEPRGVVGLRGAGFTYDGFYYVKSVTHDIRSGQYHQNFTLTREGTGALSPAVMP